eukprot:gene35035-45356_t
MKSLNSIQWYQPESESLTSQLQFEDEVKALSSPVREKLEDILHEMTVASSSAVDTLTDVLDYELIDAGTLTLDLRWSPLVRFLEGKLKWAEIVASAKQVTLAIEDNTVATAAGIRNLSGRTSRDSALMGELFVRDIEGRCLEQSVHVAESPRRAVETTASMCNINHSPVGGTVSIKLDYSPFTSTTAGVFLDYHVATASSKVVGMLRIEVCDSGRGFAAEEQEQVAADLRRFNGRDLKGEATVGLGMWIAQGIVKLHQGCFGLYSDGIEQGCRVVVELPLYSNPTTPLTDEDQSQLTSILRAWEVNHGSRIAGAERRMVTDVLPFDDASLEAVGPTTPQPPLAEIDNGNGSLAQFQQIPCLEDLDLSEQAHEIEIPRKERSHSHAKAAHTSFSAHSKVFPDTVIDPPLDDLDEKKSSDVKAKPPPSDSMVFAAGDAAAASAGRASEGLRFLIVVSWYCHLDHIYLISFEYSAVWYGVTGNALPADIALFLASGADQVLLKPLNKALFMTTLLSFIDKEAF